jgi:hypothetical protein
MTKSDLQALQTCQIQLILHAMRFPSVTRITYSTCSINREENEDVVEKILRRQLDWELAPALPSWPGRGIPNDSFTNADMCVRSSVHLETHGFFVALFVRKPSTSQPKSSQFNNDEITDTSASPQTAVTNNGRRKRTIQSQKKAKKKRRQLSGLRLSS